MQSTDTGNEPTDLAHRQSTSGESSTAQVGRTLLSSKSDPVHGESLKADASDAFDGFDPATILEGAPSWPELLSMFNGNASLLAEVLSLLIREAPRMRKLFDMSLEQGNSLEARRAVHTLKSNVRYVGLTKVAAVAERLERIARDGQTDQLRKHAVPLSQTIDHIINWSETMLRSR